MFLKSLTLRGFKSFADKTVLDFEPGITVIVGPNGSGKSNVVDAIAWVLGEQGVKSLRGGKMEDVIFAGTGKRPPLGRAEVTLTIDNSAGLLPIEYTEVTVARHLYRSGESEYALNGTTCRLLDIQELLSDTGVGRELHTILGQGQLDEVLQGRPEDRRAAIEEAAGVYKHRRRKEKALRKLAGMEQHLARLSDLVGELRRQLKPLQQQAETARRAAEVAAELREVRLTLRARELATARRRTAKLERDEVAFSSRLAELEAAHAAAQSDETRLAEVLGGAEPAAGRARETVHRLTTIRERLRGTRALAEERARHLAQALAEEGEARSPADLEREADELAAELAHLDQEVAAAARTTEQAESRRAEAHARLARFDERAAGAERDRAETHRREVDLAAEVAGLRRAGEQATAEVARLGDLAVGVRRRHAEAAGQLAALTAELDELEAGGANLAETLAKAEEARDRQAAERDRLAAEERRLEEERAAVGARRQAFEATARAAGADALAALRAAGTDGILGPLATALEIEAGYEAAVAAALGPDADALLAAGPDAAAGAATALRQTGSGRAILLHPAPAGPGADAGPADGDGLLAGHVHAAGPAGDVARELLAGVLLADDLDRARDLAARHPARRVVTVAGELVAAGRVEGGAAPQASGLAARRAAERAAEAEQAAHAELDTLAAELRTAARELAILEAGVEGAAAAIREADLHAGDLRQRLALVAANHQRLGEEAAALAARRDEVTATGEQHAEPLADAERRLAALAAEQRDAAPLDPAARAPLLAEADEAQQGATAARVSAAAVAERHRMLTRREADLRAQATAEAAAAERRAIARAARAAGAHRAGEAARLARVVLRRLDGSITGAEGERDRLVETVRQARAELDDAGRRRRAAGDELDQHRAATRASDSARVEARVRAEDLATRLVEEFSLHPDDAIREYVPDEAGLAELASGDPRHLPDQELRRIATVLDRRLTLLGRVNPLALEEFKALEERYAFLSSQLTDLKESRRDLLKVVRAVDERVREVFGQAFIDVASEFERTFALLFPGGEGRLVLTEPDDLLGSGVEVEARPPGKRVRRLSLLSGGERSLAALAFCFAVFRARPSPFYVLDEVEAALDDVNLQRFLDLLDDAREHAQLLVVSHQRRTMEAADALYGVSMQAEGVSKVVSQRLRVEPRPLRRTPRPPVAELDLDAAPGRGGASAQPAGNGGNPVPTGRTATDRTSSLEV
ncbi:MAG TPA: chromosome segregation protein SMC [Actinomycetota bacterium]|nr:chromosome segregation protein SMC [Actinomycetota bacterium]